MHAVPLFAELDMHMLEQLAQASEGVDVHAGDVVLHEGDAADAFYIVRAGLLEVVRGSACRVRLLRAGMPFGELALLGHGTRTATVRAVRDTKLWRISRSVFEACLESEAAFARSMINALSALVFESAPWSDDAPSSRSVFSIVPLQEGLPVESLIDGLHAALGSASVIRRPQSAPGAWPRLVEESEQVGLPVLMVADSDRDEWFEFCTREPDRVVLVADPSRPVAGLHDNSAFDLVLIGPALPGAVARALMKVAPRAHHVIDQDDRESVARMSCRICGTSLGVVMSGGGARGLAHLGVLQALDAAGLRVDRYGGTSMGALVAALAAQGRPLADVADCLRRELAERKPFSDYAVPRVSLIRARRAASMLTRLFGNTAIEELPRDFFCMTSDLVSAEPVAHRRGPVVEAVGASMSLPGVAPPVRLGDRLLVDGGVLDNLPVQTMLSADEGPVIAVDVLARGMPGARRTSRNGKASPLPGIVETLARSTTLASRRSADEQRALAALTIAPDLSDVSLFDFRRFDEIVATGRRAAEHALAEGSIAGLRPDRVRSHP
jgi:predicted acylesterase/phospholipase RssA